MTGGAVVWLTGLPASGKTTLARALVAALRADARTVLWLDSDDLRPHLVGPDAAYDDATRDRFYGAIGHLACLGADGGAVVVVSATAHRRAWRDAVRARVARFIEVHVATDAATCAARDPKGLYRAAASGHAPLLPGRGVDYEAPLAPEIVTADQPVADAVRTVLARISERGGRAATPSEATGVTRAAGARPENSG